MKFYSDSQHLCPVSRGIPVNTLAASLHSWHSSYILARCFLIVATYYKHHKKKQTNELAPVVQRVVVLLCDLWHYWRIGGLCKSFTETVVLVFSLKSKSQQLLLMKRRSSRLKQWSFWSSLTMLVMQWCKEIYQKMWCMFRGFVCLLNLIALALLWLVKLTSSVYHAKQFILQGHTQLFN